MKKITKFALIALLCESITFQVLGQRLSNSRKFENAKFTEVNELLQKSSILESVDKNSGLQVIYQPEFNSDVFERLFEENDDFVILQVPYDDKDSILSLKLEKVRTFDSYSLKTSSGKLHKKLKILNYRGFVNGLGNSSIVALTITENEVIGFISIEGQSTLTLGKNKKNNKQTLLRDSGTKLSSEHDFCFTSSEQLNPKLNSIYEGLNNSGYRTAYTQSAMMVTNDDQNHLTVYIETDHGIYQNSSNSVANVEAFVIGLFNQVATLYNNEGIYLQISEIFVWDTADPYSSNIATGLEDFVDNRSSFNGDLAHLLSFRSGDFDPNNTSNAGGIANGIGGLCTTGNSDLSPHAHTSLFLDFETVPTFSRQVKVVTHEIGHNLGSRHTHACVWNGNNTAIDGCADATEGSCSVLGYPTGGGTIMSYCDRQTVGVNFNLGFGNQPGDVIREMVNTSTCLDCNLEIANEVLSESTTLETCDLEMTNVTIENNTDVIINHTGTVEINGTLEAELGTTLEIKPKNN